MRAGQVDVFISRALTTDGDTGGGVAQLHLLIGCVWEMGGGVVAGCFCLLIPFLVVKKKGGVCC